MYSHWLQHSFPSSLSYRNQPCVIMCSRQPHILFQIPSLLSNDNKCLRSYSVFSMTVEVKAAWPEELNGLQSTQHKMATQRFIKAEFAFHSAPRTKTPCRSSRRFLFSHEVFANPVSNHASRPLMQVKSLRAEAAQSCSTQLPLHELLKDDDKQREMSLAISYKMSSLAIPYKMSRVNPDSR